MTVQEALALVYDSNPWKNAKGEPTKAWRLWSASNSGEASKLLAFASNIGGPRPALQTKYGRGMVELVARGLYAVSPTAVLEPVPVPVPVPPPRPGINGAVLDAAGNMTVDLLRNAGITHVAVDLRDTDSLRDFAFRGANGDRWDGFQKYGGFYVSFTDPEPGEGEWIAQQLAAHDLEDFVVVDTEHHKADLPDGVYKPHMREWTDALYDQIEDALDPAVFVADVCFGRDSSAQVVNYTRKRLSPVDSMIRETYSGSGETQGVYETTAHVNGEGFTPADLMLGNKNLDVEIPLAREMRRVGAARDVWLWGPDNGTAQGHLATGLKLS